MSSDPSKNLTLLWMQAQPGIEAYLNGMIRDRAIAEDLLQQVALTVTEKFEQFDASRSFTGWAMGIARYRQQVELGVASLERSSGAGE